MDWNISKIKINPKLLQGVLSFEAPVSVHGVVKGNCTIGFLSYIGARSEIYNGTSIGRFCSIAADVVVAPTNHPTDRLTTHLISFSNAGPFKGSEDFAEWVRGTPLESNKLKTYIGNDVWVGRGVTIKKGVTIGDGAVIGAGSVVVNDIPPYTIVGGVPAKEIKKRFNGNVIQRLLKSQWWEYQLDKKSTENVDFSDVELFLEWFEKKHKENKLSLLKPDSYVVSQSGLEKLEGLFR